jgi:hypothetical protein
MKVDRSITRLADSTEEGDNLLHVGLSSRWLQISEELHLPVCHEL